MTPENQTPSNGLDQVDEVVGTVPQTFHPAEPFVAPAPDELNVPDTVGEDAPVAAAEPVAAPAPAVEEEEIEKAFNFPAPKPNNNATYSVPYAKALETEWDDLATIIALPADTAARTMNYGQTVDNPQLAEGPEGEAWTDAIGTGHGHGSFHDNMLPAAQREGADFQQKIIHGGRPLSIAQPRIADDEGPLLTGKRGMLRINALLGRGAIIQVPLWHSGFWLTLQMPEELELLDTFDRIIGNKISFGRQSNGLAFANHAVIDNGAVVDLAMRCLYETTLKDVNSETELRALIKAPDIHLIAWGLAVAMYPRGFQFERSILDPKGMSTTVVRETLNVGALLWTDRSSLDEWQITHMAKRATGSMTKEMVKSYTDRFVRGAAKPVMLSDKLGLTLRVPSIDEYLTAGQVWIDELTAAINESLTQELSAKQRSEKILDRARATSMRQYVHWIESIDIPEQEKKMVAREDIADTVSNLSSDNAIRNKYYELMREYINGSTIAMIGVPQVHPDEKDQVLPRFENIIPLDPISVFFSLLSQKIQQIRMRP
jgi:hypothetical protein